MLLGQWHHQFILRKAVEELGGTVELSTELTSDGITQDDNGVDVKLRKVVDETAIEETARFKYVVGADGANSTFVMRKNSKAS